MYESNDLSGDIIECNESDLSWIDIDKVMNLNLWEGDRIFLKDIVLVRLKAKGCIKVIRLIK